MGWEREKVSHVMDSVGLGNGTREKVSHVTRAPGPWKHTWDPTCSYSIAMNVPFLSTRESISISVYQRKLAYS